MNGAAVFLVFMVLAFIGLLIFAENKRGVIGGDPATWGPPIQRKNIGGDPATWGPPLRENFGCEECG